MTKGKKRRRWQRKERPEAQPRTKTRTNSSQPFQNTVDIESTTISWIGTVWKLWIGSIISFGGESRRACMLENSRSGYPWIVIKGATNSVMYGTLCCDWHLRRRTTATTITPDPHYRGAEGDAGRGDKPFSIWWLLHITSHSVYIKLHSFSDEDSQGAVERLRSKL